VSDKFAEYNDVLTRLVSETVSCTPKEWTKGALTIECDGSRINYKLKNDEEPGSAVISEKLRDLIDEFYVRMSRRGEPWIEAVVTFHQDGTDLKFNTSFKYHQTTNPPVSAPRRPWWKVW
jgi:hypothetical protein